jgi:iron complex outermembrane recepter protein
MHFFRKNKLAQAMAVAAPLFGLSTATVHAQAPEQPAAQERTNPPESSGTLPTVTIHGQQDAQLPRPRELGRSVVDTRRASVSDTAKLLLEVPGASVNGAGGVSGLPSLRGLADDRLRVKVDGMDLIASCPNHMNPVLSYIAPSQVGSMTVFAGISPVSVGGDSIGGSVLAESASPVFADAQEGTITKGEIGTYYRSNNRARGVNLSATYATPSLSLGYSGAVGRADNYHAGGDFKDYDFSGRVGHSLARDEVGSTGYDTRNHALALAFRLDDHLWEARVSAQEMPDQRYPNQRMDLLKNDQRSVNLSYVGEMDWGVLKARVYDEQVDHFMDFGADKRFWYGADSGGSMAVDGRPCGAISATCAAGMPMFTKGKTQGASVSGDIAWRDNQRVRVGAELQRYRLDDWWPASGSGMWPGTFWNIRDGQRDRTAVFGEWESSAWSNWTTLAGVRVERVRTDAGEAVGYNPAGGGFQGRDAAAFNASERRRTDHNMDATALARYTVSEQQSIELGLAHKERSPSVYERFPWSTWQMAALMNNFVGDGNGYMGNLDLQPEKANTVSATFNWHAPDRSWGFEATPYYTRIIDYIDAQPWDPVANRPAPSLPPKRFGVLRYVNQSARIQGLDLAGHMPMAEGPWGRWGLKGLLNYTSGKNLDTGDGLYNTMPLNARLTLSHKVGGWDNAVELVAVKAKTRVSSTRNEVHTAGYGLVHLRGSYAWKRVRLDFGVENLFDRLYGLPTGGAYVGQGTTMTNPMLPNYPQWGTAVPGMGRTLYAGVNLSF